MLDSFHFCWVWSHTWAVLAIKPRVHGRYMRTEILFQRDVKVAWKPEPDCTTMPISHYIFRANTAQA